MINVLDKSATIGEVVAELPQSSVIFGKYGIDFCCGGHRKLYDVILDQKINQDDIYEELRIAQDERKNSYSQTSFIDMTPDILSTYIEDTHHSYLRQELPVIAELLGTIARVHGKNHPEIFEVYKLFGTIKSDLEQHLLKEETMLFPAISQNGSVEEIRPLAGMIIEEHITVGEALAKLREITDDFTTPADGCGTYRKTYEKLEEMEKDLHQHIHLENNILLKEYDTRCKCEHHN